MKQATMPRPTPAAQLPGMLLSALLLAASTPFTAMAEAAESASEAIALRPYTASYQARSHGMSTTAERTLSHGSDQRYQLQQGLAVRLLGATVIAIEEGSHFLWQDNQAIPLEYQYRQRGISRRNQQLRFDWSIPEASFINNNETYPFAIHFGVLDPLGFSVQMSADVKQATSNQSGQTDFEFHIADDNSIVTHLYRITGEEQLQTGAGLLDTVVLERIREPDNPRSTIIWLARNKDFILARLEQIDRSGSRTELLLDAVSWQP